MGCQNLATHFALFEGLLLSTAASVLLQLVFCCYFGGFFAIGEGSFEKDGVGNWSRWRSWAAMAACEDLAIVNQRGAEARIQKNGFFCTKFNQCFSEGFGAHGAFAACAKRATIFEDSERGSSAWVHGVLGGESKDVFFCCGNSVVY